MRVRDGLRHGGAAIGARPTYDTEIQTDDWDALEDLVLDLERHKLDVQRIAFASADSARPIVEVLVGLGGLTGLASILRAFFHRHDGKQIFFEFNGQTIDLRGMSEKNLEALIRELTNLSDQ